MDDVAKHANTDSGLRRARAAAWTVFLSMAGTTIAFQVYHSVKYGQMPEFLAVLFGVVLLVISVCVLEVIAEWHGSQWWVKTAAYAIMAGSMYMSAGATSEVVVHAAPPHMSLLFGLLLDGAALLTVHFLLSGSHAVSRAMAGAEAARRAELDAAHAAAAGERAVRESAEAALESLRAELATARQDLADAVAKTETLARKLAGNRTRKPGGTNGRKPPRKPAGNPAPETRDATAPDETADVDSEALVLRYLAEGFSASEAGRKAGLSDSRGRQIARNLAKTAPQDAVPDSTS